MFGVVEIAFVLLGVPEVVDWAVVSTTLPHEGTLEKTILLLEKIFLNKNPVFIVYSVKKRKNTQRRFF